MKKLIVLLACTALFTACNRDTGTGMGGDTDIDTGTGTGTSTGTIQDTGSPMITTNVPGAATGQSGAPASGLGATGDQTGALTNDPALNTTPPPALPPPQDNANQGAGAGQPVP